ncbi:MAG TPA: hypothetical protein VIQ02_17145 [Jiangellaceae bacterium]
MSIRRDLGDFKQDVTELAHILWITLLVDRWLITGQEAVDPTEAISDAGGGS